MPGITRGTSPHQSSETWVDSRPVVEHTCDGELVDLWRITGNVEHAMQAVRAHLEWQRQKSALRPGRHMLRCGKQTVEV